MFGGIAFPSCTFSLRFLKTPSLFDSEHSGVPLAELVHTVDRPGVCAVLPDTCSSSQWMLLRSGFCQTAPVDTLLAFDKATFTIPSWGCIPLPSTGQPQGAHPSPATGHFLGWHPSQGVMLLHFPESVNLWKCYSTQKCMFMVTRQRLSWTKLK